jgi:chromosome segregation ATPase
MKMKTRNLRWTGFFAVAILVTACGSQQVTLEDVREQENKTLQEINEAKQASVKLAEMKQQFSEDYKVAKMNALKKQVKEIDKDIERLSGVTTSEAQSGTKGLVSDLKSRRQKLQKEMQDVERLEKENWEQTMTAINQEIESIKQLIQKITANLSEKQPVEEG